MKAEFTLSKIDKAKDSLTGRLTFTESNEFKVFGVVYALCYTSFFMLDILEVDVANWVSLSLLATGFAALLLAYVPISMARRAGKVVLTEKNIQLYPTIDEGYFPDSPISLEHIDHLKISTIQSIRWWSSFIILHFEIDEQSEFGLTINRKKDEKQYLEVLESWYRNGFPVEEYNTLGTRTFKLDKGQNYADVQKIKSEYGISW